MSATQATIPFEPAQGLDAQALLDWALAAFGSRLTLACSLGLEDVVLVDLLDAAGKRAGLRPRAFVLDTGRLHPETHDTLAALQRRYDVAFEVYAPLAGDVEALVARQGVNGFYEGLEQRKACCGVRKVEPLGRALKGAGAWITGLRREQAPTRTGIPTIEPDPEHGGLLKLNPLAAWTLDEVWAYVKAHGVPYNPLHDRGYPSIGCAPCTRAVGPGEDLRAGRWWWERPEHKECGLHGRRER